MSGDNYRTKIISIFDSLMYKSLNKDIGIIII